MTKTVYIIGHKGRSFDDKWHIYFHTGMRDGVLTQLTTLQRLQDSIVAKN